MVRTKDELLAAIRDFLGDRTDDDALAILDDVADTLDANAEGETWRVKYEENDAAWRKRYKDRFSGETEDEPEGHERVDEEKEYAYEDLFEEEE